MSEKRTYGNGSVFERKSDGRWVAAFTDPITGKRRRIYCESQNAARAQLRKMVSRADAGEVVFDARSSLRAYGDAWLEDRAGRRRSPATVGLYEGSLKRYVYPRLGSVRLGEITVVDVEDVLDEMAAKGLSESTIKITRNALAALLTDAIRARHLRAGNVARMAQMPEMKPSAKVVPPTTQQVLKLLEVTEGTELGRILTLLTMTGARIGEVLALQWSAVDLETGDLTIEATAAQDRKGRLVRSDRTKSRRSRVVTLGPRGIQVLKDQRREVAERRLEAVHWEDHDLVFPTPIGTMIDSRNLRTQQFREVAAKVGWPGSFHALRHYVASVSLADGSNAFLTSKVLGHSRIATTTDIYGHLLTEDVRGVFAAVERRLEGPGRGAGASS
jgi:integrase